MIMKLLQNSFIYVLGDVLNKSIPFFMLPVLTRYLTPEDYGIISVYTSLVAVFAVFTGLSVHGAVNVNFFRISKEELKIYIGNALIVLNISSIIVLVVVYVLKSYLQAKLQIPPEWLFVAVILAFSQFITTLNLVLWTAEQKPRPYTLYQLSQTALTMCFSLIFIIGFSMGWQGQLIAQSTGIVLFAGISFIFLIKRGYLIFNLNKTYIVDALKFGVPLIPHALSSWIRTGADRMILLALIGSHAAGIYSVGYQFGMVISVVATAFNKAWSPHMFRVLSQKPDIAKKKKIVIATYLYFIAILLFALFVTVVARIFLPYFVGEKFSEAYKYIPYIAIAFSFQGMYFMVGNYVLYEKCTKVLAYITFASGIIHIGIAYLLIIKNGAIGSAQATLVSFFITFIATWMLSCRVYKMPWKIWRY